MNQNLSKLGSQLAAIWKQLGAPQRLSVIIATLAVLGGLGGLAFWTSRADHALLYGKLSDTESARVIAALDEAKVTYQFNAARTRLVIIAQNIANANTTRGLDGKPYRRQTVVFESLLRQAADGSTGLRELRVAVILRDQRPPQLVFNPGHPDANAVGMVAMPNVNIHEEMADMIVVSRAYEANLAVMKNSRMLALRANRGTNI